MEQTNLENGNSNIPVFKVDPIMVLILGLVTCGLYFIYWNIKAAEVINAVNKREVISSPIAILSWLCPFVGVYQFYILAKDGMPELYKATNQPQKDDTVLYVILALVFALILPMIVQGEINKLYK